VRAPTEEVEPGMKASAEWLSTPHAARRAIARMAFLYCEEMIAMLSYFVRLNVND
jgi:hypothetical protein